MCGTWCVESGILLQYILIREMCRWIHMSSPVSLDDLMPTTGERLWTEQCIAGGEVLLWGKYSTLLHSVDMYIFLTDTENCPNGGLMLYFGWYSTHCHFQPKTVRANQALAQRLYGDQHSISTGRGCWRIFETNIFWADSVWNKTRIVLFKHVLKFNIFSAPRAGLK